MLTQVLDKLRTILTSIDDAVAYYQISNEFRKIFEKIDSKSETIINIRKTSKLEKLESIEYKVTVNRISFIF